MDALARSYLDVMLAQALVRATRDVEAQVAFWLLEDRAEHADLVAARGDTAAAQRSYGIARRRYSQLSAKHLSQSRARGPVRSARHGG